MTRDAWLCEVRTWAGVPFRHQGRSRQGVDCLGLILGPAAALGIRLPAIPAYGRNVGIGFFREALESRGCLRAGTRRPQPGDLVLFAIQRSWIGHLGILVGGGRMLHASAAAGKVVSVAALGWRPYLQAVYLPPGLSEGDQDRAEGARTGQEAALTAGAVSIPSLAPECLPGASQAVWGANLEAS